MEVCGELWQIYRLSAGIINDCQFGEANDSAQLLTCCGISRGLCGLKLSPGLLFKCCDLYLLKIFTLLTTQTHVHI